MYRSHLSQRAKSPEIRAIRAIAVIGKHLPVPIIPVDHRVVIDLADPPVLIGLEETPVVIERDERIVRPSLPEKPAKTVSFLPRS